ncbi:MAG TPA: LemA family protein [Thermoanaerobaculia bacterium]|nr:LemA family protein [Thermoanaerobaculia bacterium]
MTSTIILLVLVGLVVVLAAWLIGLYNGLVRLRNRYENAFAQIDVQLKRRYDLIPNLVETAKGYLKHERETLEGVIAARNRAVNAEQAAAKSPGDPSAMAELGRAEGVLGGMLGRLFALSEAYPDLKASETMNQLMEELSSTENRVSFARQAYNDAVTAYNTRRESVPTNLVANSFGFTEAQLFVIDEEVQREAPKVSFT